MTIVGIIAANLACAPLHSEAPPKGKSPPPPLPGTPEPYPVLLPEKHSFGTGPACNNPPRSRDDWKQDPANLSKSIPVHDPTVAVPCIK
ncbi:hypothetical protein K431DRAFT_29093 [Polychaeton citri CBS 116435]|uniref:Uncharacterized protein n=1 Tax=Polychaeton citri CBS 116435 TaxID=1314669 RepID=A0A9P4US80_9PEZI|nr:hypothetical protein K431DRAFT_29093 [Polychaeton citri CBS 116435]